MKRLISVVLVVTLMCVFLLVPVGALTVYDENGQAVGTSVLTSSNGGRIYNLKVTDTTGSGRAYGRIYLYDANQNTIDGGWDGYYEPYFYTNYVELTKGNSSISPSYRSIWSKICDVRYVYYDEY